MEILNKNSIKKAGRTNPRSLIIKAIIAVLLLVLVYHKSLISKPTTGMISRACILEELNAYFYSGNQAVGVFGRIKNATSYYIRGFIVLYFYDAEDNLLGTQQVWLNGKSYIPPKKSVSFESYYYVDNNKKASRVSLEFVELERRLK